MSKLNSLLLLKTSALLCILLLASCSKFERYKQPPELGSLQQGLRAGTAVGYCVSVAYSAFKGYPLPDNVIFDQKSGFIYIHIDQYHPLQFNKNIGDIVIAGKWDINGGVMAILFANIDILEGKLKLYGLDLVPFMEQNDGSGILAVFAKQNIIVGNGSDTILNLGDLTELKFNAEMDRLNEEKPNDAFAVVKQNVWFINVDQNNTFTDVYDDDITINGGGQIAEVNGTSGGIIYHAMINTRVNYSVCSQNPFDGYALSQNFKAGDNFIDLGNSLLSFHNSCDGKAHVDLSTGKYLWYNGKNISLNLN